MKEHSMILPLAHMHNIKSNVLDQSGLRIARCDFDGQMCAEADANAAYIIKCVNGYDALRTALRESTELLRVALCMPDGEAYGFVEQIAANEAVLAKGSER